LNKGKFCPNCNRNFEFDNNSLIYNFCPTCEGKLQVKSNSGSNDYSLTSKNENIRKPVIHKSKYTPFTVALMYIIGGILVFIFLGYFNLISLFGTIFVGILGSEPFLIEPTVYTVFYWPNLVIINWVLPLVFYVIGFSLFGNGILILFGAKKKY
jgi:hypothetical protein